MRPNWTLSSRLSYVLWRRRYASLKARLRAFWHHVVCGYGSETCTDCGRRTEFAWVASNDLWNEHVGPGKGILCARCFDGLLATRGLFVRWRPEAGRKMARP